MDCRGYQSANRNWRLSLIRIWIDILIDWICKTHTPSIFQSSFRFVKIIYRKKFLCRQWHIKFVINTLSTSCSLKCWKIFILPIFTLSIGLGTLSLRQTGKSKWKYWVSWTNLLIGNIHWFEHHFHFPPHKCPVMLQIVQEVQFAPVKFFVKFIQIFIFLQQFRRDSNL